MFSCGGFGFARYAEFFYFICAIDFFFLFLQSASKLYGNWHPQTLAIIMRFISLSDTLASLFTLILYNV